MIKHSAGPWHVEIGSHTKDYKIRIMTAQGTEDECVALLPNDGAQVEANARLIVMAPDLLELARICRRHLHASGMTDDELSDIDAIIARAEGVIK